MRLYKSKVCKHNTKKHKFSIVYWACDSCFLKYKFDPIKHTIIGKNIK